MQCPFCANDNVPQEARFCPRCEERFYIEAGTDYTPQIAEHTRAFTGRKWVFQAIDDWLADRDGPRLFLLSGGPGTGKSAIAARLVQMAEGGFPSGGYPHLCHIGFIFYQFCEAFHDPTLDPIRFVTRLSLHLAAQYPVFAKALTRAQGQDPEVNVQVEVAEAAPGAVVAGVVIQNLHLGNLSARQAFDRVVHQPLERLCTPDFPDTILILVDALDAALAYPGETIVEVLQHTIDRPQDLPCQVRILVTSRRDDRIQYVIGMKGMDLVDDAPPDVDDVSAYALSRLQILPEPERSALARRVSAAGKGNFLYVRHVLDELLPTWSQGKNLDTLPLPHDLYDVYRRFLKRELACSLDSWEDDYAPLLALLAVARGEGLSQKQLAEVTRQARPQIRRLLRVCGQYLAGPQPDGPFRIFHQSFRDFLLQDDQCRLEAEEADRTIATRFLQRGRNGWPDCDDYGLRYLPTHMAAARLDSELRALLLDVGWIRAKLGASDITAVLTDYELLPNDPEVALVRDALRLSAHVLATDRSQLSGQLHGRLLGRTEGAIAALLDQARATDTGAWLRPLVPSLDAPGGPLVRTLTGHSGGVTAVLATPDGQFVVSASQDRTLKLWHLGTGQPVRTLVGHKRPVEAIAITPDGRQVVSVSYDDTARIWDPATGREVRILEGNLPPTQGAPSAGQTVWITSVAVTPDARRVLLALDDGRLLLQDLETGEVVLVLTGHHDCVRQVAITPDGHRAVSASHDNQVKVWDLDSGDQVHALHGHGCPVTSVAVTPDGALAVSGSYDKQLRIWELASGRPQGILEGHRDRVLAVTITRDGRRAVSASADRTLRVWDLATRRCLQTLAGHADWIQAVTVTPDGRQAISGSSDCTLKVWELTPGEGLAATASGRTVRSLGGHDGAVGALAVTPDGLHAVSASYDHTLKVWDLAARQGLDPQCESRGPGYEPRTLAGHAGWVQAVALTPSGQHALSASQDKTLKLWFLKRGKLLHTFQGHADAVRAVAVVPGGRLAISGSYDGTVAVWDLTSGQRVQTLEGHTAEVMSVAVTPDGRRAVSASYDHTVRVWDLPTRGLRGGLLHTLQGHADVVSTVVLTPDGLRAVSASRDFTLRVWDLALGRTIHRLAGHRHWVSSVAITQDGRLAVSSSHDRSLKVWDLVSGEELATLAGHTGSVQAVVLTPDGALAVSAAMDRTVRVWDISSLLDAALLPPGPRDSSERPATPLHAEPEARAPIAVFQAEDALTTVVIARDGRSIVAGDSSGRVHILRLEGPAPASQYPQRRSTEQPLGKV